MQVHKHDQLTVSHRDSIQVDLRYRIAGETRWFLAQTTNVSDTGILFHCGRALDPGMELEMYLVERDRSGAELPPLHICLGRVVRNTPGPKNNIQAETFVAVEFRR
jgi:hypothetical protein